MVGKYGTAVIPTLQSGDKVVEDDKAKAELPLSTFFPPTPTIPEQTLTEPGRNEPLPFYTITRAEVKAVIILCQIWPRFLCRSGRLASGTAMTALRIR
jgi:hypothetical protein